MTNQTNSSQNQTFPNRNKFQLEAVLKLVEAHPFKALLKLPPEEVLDFFHRRVGVALLEGLQELKRRELEGLMLDNGKHAEICDSLFEVRGINTVCQMLIDLPEKVKQYVEATRGAK